MGTSIPGCCPAERRSSVVMSRPRKYPEELLEGRAAAQPDPGAARDQLLRLRVPADVEGAPPRRRAGPALPGATADARQRDCRRKARGKPWRTTRPDPQAARRPDLVHRDFTATRPTELWVADISYLRCWQGLVFFDFVLDAYSRMIIGWQLAPHMRTDLVVDAAGDVRFVIVMRDFDGMSGGAIWQDLKIGIEHLRSWKRIAHGHRLDEPPHPPLRLDDARRDQDLLSRPARTSDPLGRRAMTSPTSSRSNTVASDDSGSGTGLGDRFRASRGRSRRFEHMHRRDGKGGVRGSSPRERTLRTPCLQFFSRLLRRQKRGVASTERPRLAASAARVRSEPAC